MIRSTLISFSRLRGLGDFVCGLHAHQGVHSDAEGFFNAERHVAGEGGFAVEQTGEGWAGDLKRCGCRCHREALSVQRWPRLVMGG